MFWPALLIVYTLLANVTKQALRMEEAPDCKGMAGQGKDRAFGLSCISNNYIYLAVAQLHASKWHTVDMTMHDTTFRSKQHILWCWQAPQ